MFTDQGNGFFAWDGKLFHSDIVRACIRPKVKAIGKTIGKHIRDDGTNITVNPEPYLRFLLEEPNPFMTGQMLQEKLATQLALNNNAFAVIIRDSMGYPMEIYPTSAASMVEAIYDKNMNLFLRFTFLNGRRSTFAYSDIIHLRRDFNSNDIFGESPARALSSLMDIICTTDQGIVKAVKNSNIIKWLLKYNQSIRPEDLADGAKNFAKNYLSIESSGNVGVAATDSKAEAIQVDPKDWVPNALLIDRITDRVYSFFNTNKKIVQSDFGENDWNSYYEAEVEPDVIQLSGEYTRKIFSRKERGFGNRIYFEASNLQWASMTTKLALMQMVDRGAMTPNEWRETLSLAPIEGGDKPIRRLDTAVVASVKALIGKMNGSDNDKTILQTITRLLDVSVARKGVKEIEN